MKPGDLVQFTLPGYSYYIRSEVKVGIFLSETEEMVDSQGIQEDTQRSWVGTVRL